jgi:hypothetical protein
MFARPHKAHPMSSAVPQFDEQIEVEGVDCPKAFPRMNKKRQMMNERIYLKNKIIFQ